MTDQRDEKIEQLSCELRAATDRAVKAEASVRLLTSDVSRLEKSCKALEGAVLEAQGRAGDFFVLGAKATKRLLALRSSCDVAHYMDDDKRDALQLWLLKQRSVHARRLLDVLDHISKAVKADRREEYADG